MCGKVYQFDSFGEMGEFVDFCHENGISVNFQPNQKAVTVLFANGLASEIEHFEDYLDGTEGQDRESYSDDQDRDSYAVQ